MALSIFVLVALIGFGTGQRLEAGDAKIRLAFPDDQHWDPGNDVYCALRSFTARLFHRSLRSSSPCPSALPPQFISPNSRRNGCRQPLTMFIELLAAVPSVILGLWGIL